MDNVELVQGPTEIVEGDAVTPTEGVWRGRRFLAMQVVPVIEAYAPPQVQIRPDPPQQGARPLLVPAAELVHFFRAGDCPVCGDPSHRRCEPAPRYPQIGWRVEALVGYPGDIAECPAGSRGVVEGVDRVYGIVQVALDTGHTWRFKAANFFTEWGIL